MTKYYAMENIVNLTDISVGGIKMSKSMLKKIYRHFKNKSILWSSKI